MDSSHVVIFEIDLPKEWFDVYILKDGTHTIGIHSVLFYKVLNSRDKSQMIHMECENNDSITLRFVGEDKKIFDTHFEIPLVDLEMDMLNIPEIEHQAEFTLMGVTFANLVNQLKNFGDTMKIECSEEKIGLCSFSVEHGKMFAEIPIDDLQEFAIEEGETLNISFGLKYLHDICLYHKLSKQVDIKISSNFPMMIVYKLGTNTTENNDTTDSADTAIPKMTFFLAPKVDDDD